MKRTGSQLIVAGPALDDLVTKGGALRGAAVELALSPIGLCDRASPWCRTSPPSRSFARFSSMRDRSPTPTVPAASISRRRCSGRSAWKAWPKGSAKEFRHSRRRDRAAWPGADRLPGDCQDSSCRAISVCRPHSGTGGIPDTFLGCGRQQVQESRAGETAYCTPVRACCAACTGEDGTGAAEEIARDRPRSVSTSDEMRSSQPAYPAWYAPLGILRFTPPAPPRPSAARSPSRCP